MRFIPQTFFNIGGDPCVTSYATGAVSSSIQYGSVNYDVYVFTCSLQAGKSGGGVEYGQLFISEGYSRRAVVVCVGGGGAGSSDGNGGGGGGVTVADNVFLIGPQPYNIQIGQGADGTERSSQGLAFSGDDGSTTAFTGIGGLDIIANGGQGGNLGGYGGTSGDGYHSSGSGGAGAAEGTLTSGSGQGFSLFLGPSTSNTPSDPTIRAGGGGQGEDYAGLAAGYKFGGGGYADARGLGIDGSGGSILYNIVTVGGGGTGGQYYDNIDLVYRSSKGGGGAVIVAIPNNLCSSSLYELNSEIVQDSLVSYYDSTNVKGFGKDLFAQQLLNLVGNENLIHNNLIASDNYERINYTGSQSIYSSGSYIIGDGGGKSDLFTSTAQFSASQDFTLEWIGMTPYSDSLYQQDCIKLGDVSFPSSSNYLVRFYIKHPELIEYEYYDGTTSTKSSTVSNVNISNSLRQHALTYNSTLGILSYYLDGNVQNSISVSITSSLDNPTLYIGATDSFTRTKEFRVYQKELTSSELIQNFSASVVPEYPTASYSHSFSYDASDRLGACQASPSTTLYSFDEVLTVGSALLTNQTFPYNNAADGYYSSGSNSYEVALGGGIQLIKTCAVECELYRFTAGIYGGNATYEPCSVPTSSVTVPLSSFEVRDICLVSGSAFSLTGTGASITYLSTCTGSL